VPPQSAYQGTKNPVESKQFYQRRRGARSALVLLFRSRVSLEAETQRARCVSGYRSLHCRFIRRRPGGSSLDASRRQTASDAGSANRRPSPSWASPLSAAKLVGQITNQTEVPEGPHAGKVASYQTGIATEHASADSPAGKMVAPGRHRLLQLQAVPTNGPTLTAFLFHVTNLWRRTLQQRSQKDWTTWERIKRLARRLAPATANPSSVASEALRR
jgi:hypothetical protein